MNKKYPRGVSVNLIDPRGNMDLLRRGRRSQGPARYVMSLGSVIIIIIITIIIIIIAIN